MVSETGDEMSRRWQRSMLRAVLVALVRAYAATVRRAVRVGGAAPEMHAVMADVDTGRESCSWRASAVFTVWEEALVHECTEL